MLTMSKACSSGQAGTYFEKEYSKGDYYSEDNSVVGKWSGKLGGELNLLGEVSEEKFKGMLDGKHPDTGEQLIRNQVASGKHTAGWDIGTSAPKSVSLMALVGGDARLIEAHRRANSAAISAMEEQINARTGPTSREQTGKMVAASFDHDTSRELDPQLHTHNFVLNMAQCADGKFRAVDPAEMYRAQKLGRTVYDSTLAKEVQKLGYEIEPTGKGSFEIKGIDRNQIEQFSKRSAQIKEYMEREGVTGAGGAQIAALNTRQTKDHDVDKPTLVQQWKDEAKAIGIELERLHSEAKANVDHPGNEQIEMNSAQEAREAVRLARESLAEREAVFRGRDLEANALTFGLGRVTLEGVREAIKNDPELIKVPSKVGGEFFITKEELEREKTLADHVQASQGTVESMVSEETLGKYGQFQTSLEERAKRDGTALTERDLLGAKQQREAFETILKSRDRITFLDGKAGTGKSFLQGQMKNALESEGWKVVGLAPTGKAAENLAADGITATTLANFERNGDGIISGQSDEARDKAVAERAEAFAESKEIAREFNRLKEEQEGFHETFKPLMNDARSRLNFVQNELKESLALAKSGEERKQVYLTFRPKLDEAKGQTKDLKEARTLIEGEFSARRMDLAERTYWNEIKHENSKFAAKGQSWSSEHLAALEKVDQKFAERVKKQADSLVKAWGFRAAKLEEWNKKHASEAKAKGKAFEPQGMAYHADRARQARELVRSHVGAFREAGKGALDTVRSQGHHLADLGRSARKALGEGNQDAWQQFREKARETVQALRKDLAKTWESAQKELAKGRERIDWHSEKTRANSMESRAERVIAEARSQRQEATTGPKKIMLLVDEAGMASNRQVKALFEKVKDLVAKGKDVRVLMAGDPDQVKAVESGKAMETLMKEKGATVARLDTITRQKDKELLQVAELASQGKMKDALHLLEKRGDVKEVKDPMERAKAIAKEYLKAPKETIVVTPFNEERKRLNTVIREELKAQGKVEAAGFKTTVAAKGSETKAQLLHVGTYGRGDLVRASMNDRERGITKGEELRVVGQDARKNSLTLERENGQRLEVDLKGMKQAPFEKVRMEAREFAVGDRVMFTAKDKERGTLNNDAGTIKSLDIASGKALVELAKNGRQVEVDLSKHRDIDHGYATTVHKAQGQTFEYAIDSRPTEKGSSDRSNAYVGWTRMREGLKVFTDDRQQLEKAVEKASEKTSALEAMEKAQAAPTPSEKPQATQHEASQAKMTPPQVERGIDLRLTEKRQPSTTIPGPTLTLARKTRGIDLGENNGSMGRRAGRTERAVEAGSERRAVPGSREPGRAGGRDLEGREPGTSAGQPRSHGRTPEGDTRGAGFDHHSGGLDAARSDHSRPAPGGPGNQGGMDRSQERGGLAQEAAGRLQGRDGGLEKATSGSAGSRDQGREDRDQQGRVVADRGRVGDGPGLRSDRDSERAPNQTEREPRESSRPAPTPERGTHSDEAKEVTREAIKAPVDLVKSVKEIFQGIVPPPDQKPGPKPPERDAIRDVFHPMVAFNKAFGTTGKGDVKELAKSIEAVDKALKDKGLTSPFTKEALDAVPVSSLREMVQSYIKAGVLEKNPDRATLEQTNKAQTKKMEREQEGPELQR